MGLKKVENPFLNVYFYLLPFSIYAAKPGYGLWHLTSQHTSTFACTIFPVYSQNTSVWYHWITFKSQCCRFSCFHFFSICENCTILEVIGTFWTVIRPKSKTAFLFIHAKPLLSQYNAAVLVGNKSERRGEVLCGLRWRKAQQLLRM